MLDTVILQLEEKNFVIQDYYKFGTTEKQKFKIDKPFWQWYNNPTKQDKQNGIYLPRLTINKRGTKYFLQIEFSAPKLIFNNNLDELEETDFINVVKTLREKLLQMGVFVWTKDIEEAQILSFHPSKNIILKHNFTVDLAIKELAKTNISKRFDLDEKNYRNNGEVLQFYTNSHSFIIYDKVKDLKKPAKRATDKDKTIQQLSLFDFCCQKKTEILRIEIRFRKKKMNDILRKIGYKINPQFKEIFNKNLCKKIINQYWNEFFGKNQFIFSVNNNPQKILQIVLSQFPNLKLHQALKIVAIFLLCKDEEGIRGFRQVVDNYKPKTDWNYIKKYSELLNNNILIYPALQFLDDIKQELNEFNSLKFDQNNPHSPSCLVNNCKV